jgi:membrane protease YdiL (CAAX protease family)
MGGELALSYVAKLLGVHGLWDSTPQALLAMVGVRTVAELCLVLFGVYAILQVPLSSIGLRIPKFGELALGVAGGLATALVVALLIQKLRLQTSYDLLYEHYILSHATGLVAVALFSVLIFFGPIVEEIVFRGIVLEGFVKLTNGVVAVVVSAVIFAGMHASGGVDQVVGAFAFGLFAGWLYLRTRSVAPTSAAHIVYNAVAFYPLILYMIRARHS